MAEPTPQSFRMAIGQAIILTFTSDVAPESDVSADQMRFRLRNRRGDLLIEKDSGDGITCTDGTAGIWAVSLTDTDTFGRAETDPVTPANLSPGLYNWSFWKVGDGEEQPKAYGTCELYRTAETG